MYCTKCGSRLPDDANFCGDCGNRIDTDVPVNYGVPVDYKMPADAVTSGPEQKPQKGFKKIGVIAGAAVAAVAIVVVAVFAGRGLGNAGRPQADTEFLIPWSETVAFYQKYEKIINSNDVEYIPQTEIQSFLTNRYDYSLTCFLEEGSHEIPSLYWLDKNGNAVFVDDHVGYYEPSYTGENIFYVKYEDDFFANNRVYDLNKFSLDIATNELYIYNVESGQSKFVTTDIDYCVPSPSGEALLYYDGGTYIYTGDKGISEVSLYLNGSFVFLGVSNDGNNIYYKRGDSSDGPCEIRYCDGKTDNFVAYGQSFSNTPVMINKDLTEAICMVQEGTSLKAYLYKSGKEESTEILSIDYPDGRISSRFYSKYANARIFSDGYTPFNTLSGKAYIMGETLVWIDNGYSSEVIADDSGYYSWCISKDGQSIIYVKDKSIHKMSDLNGKKNDEILYSGDVDSVVASYDLEKIYFYEDTTLCYLNNGMRDPCYTGQTYLDFIVYNPWDDKTYFFEQNGDYQKLLSVSEGSDTVETVDYCTSSWSGERLDVKEYTPTTRKGIGDYDLGYPGFVIGDWENEQVYFIGSRYTQRHLGDPYVQ